MNFLKKLRLIGDIEDVLVAGAELADQFPAVRPTIDKLVTDFEQAITGLTFDAASAVLADVQRLCGTFEAAYGPDTEAVVDFRNAVEQLVADL